MKRISQKHNNLQLLLRKISRMRKLSELELRLSLKPCVLDLPLRRQLDKLQKPSSHLRRPLESKRKSYWRARAQALSKFSLPKSKQNRH